MKVEATVNVYKERGEEVPSGVIRELVVRNDFTYIELVFDGKRFSVHPTDLETAIRAVRCAQ